ncbi:hypothetical protein N2599_07660 [Rhizobium sullae]|nr:hypothetical protein [Rhizobium sullae]UWU15862.1 hypothetical protein N2599_07660 [Rhizobium sullae]
MKTIALLLVAFAGLPAVPDGAEIEAPVQEVMDATVQNWASESRFDLIDGIRDRSILRHGPCRFGFAKLFPA